jgi:uncharacterized membrane protein (UPF0127 family)
MRSTNASRAALRVVLFCLSAAFVLASLMAPVLAQMPVETVKLLTASGEHVIRAEIARTSDEKALGLMFRKSVPEGTGMLFPYSAPQEVTMWMRNTYISLDMIFIAADGRVHRIEERTEPLSERIISSKGPVAAVLELAAGSAQRLGLRPGDRVIHPMFAGSRP